MIDNLYLEPCTYTRDVSLCVDFSDCFPCHADAACASARDDVALVYVLCGGCYVLYAIVQNVAVTDKYGFSIVTVNVVMMLLVALLWMREAWRGAAG